MIDHEPHSDRPVDDGLSAEQRDFVTFYMTNGRNATAAHMAVYGSVPNQRKLAHTMMLNRFVADAIARANDKIAAKSEVTIKRYAISRANVLSELATIGFASMADFVKIGADGDPRLSFEGLTRLQMTAISELTVDTFVDGRRDEAREVRRVRLKLHDKRGPLMDIAKMQGWLEPERGDDDMSADRERRLQVRDEFLKLLKSLAKSEPLTIEGE